MKLKHPISGFLSKDMSYSCAIFDSSDQDKGVGMSGEGSSVRDVDELHEGQVRKMKNAIDKAHILPGQRILDIGCGWGSLAIMIAECIPSTKIDAITLSVHQQTLAQERIALAGLSDRITIHLMDYRNMPSDWKNAFDRVISIEMIEHVGKDFLEAFWSAVHWAMKLKDAIGVVQVITMPEASRSVTSALTSFLSKNCFSGCNAQKPDFMRKWVSNCILGRFVVLIYCSTE